MIKGTQSHIELYKKVRYYRRDFCAPVTLDDLKDYRWRLIQKQGSRSSQDLQEIQILDQWILENDHCFVLPNSQDREDIVRLDMCFSDEMFEAMLPDLDRIIAEENKWVCVYHVMIYYGWMLPVVFSVWVNWLNERRSAIGFESILKGSAARNVERYFRDTKRPKWILKEYMEEKGTSSPLTKQSFERFCLCCDEVTNYFNTMNTNPLTYYSRPLDAS